MTSESVPPTLRAASEPIEPMPDPGTTGPGRAIRRARERVGLSVEDFAAQLKLARTMLEALERDDFDALNEPVYVRGYYRKCAKALNLPEAELLAAYERMVAPKAPQAPTKLLIGSNPALTRARIGRDRPATGRWLLAVVIAALLGGGVWLLTHDPNGLLPRTAPPPASVPMPLPVPLPLPAPQSEAAPAAAPAATLAPAAADVAAISAAAPASLPAPAAAPAIDTATAAPAAGDPGVLALTFKATSWVRVEDADSRVLLSGVVQSGDRQALRGKPPYSVFIGNAPGVIVEYGGRPVDLTSYIKPNSTARFSVP